MSDFSSNEINDAKRRVEEMRKKARDVVDFAEESSPSDNNQTPPAQSQSSSPFSSILSGFGIDKIGGDSSLILALILILSREGADNMLILALLYILL